MGSKRHVLTDGHGTPLALVHTGANRPDHESLEPLLEQFKGIRSHRVGRPRRKLEVLYADSAYAMSPCYRAVYTRRMKHHIALKNSAHHKGVGAIRYKIERTFSWCDGYRKIRLRDARQLLTWDALHHLAIICITWKQIKFLC